MLTKEDIIQILHLAPHPEGGYFRRTYENRQKADPGSQPSLKLSSAAYYLLDTQSRSMFHSLTADETWMYHCGDPLDLYLLSDSQTDTSQPLCRLEIQTLGTDLIAGQQPQFTIPAGRIFGAKHHPMVEVHSRNHQPADQEPFGYTLISCYLCPELSLDSHRTFTQEDIQALCDGHTNALNYFFE